MDISTAFHLGGAINLRRYLFQSHLIANYGKVKVVLNGDVTQDDSQVQRRFLAQHGVAMLRHCFECLQHGNAVLC